MASGRPDISAVSAPHALDQQTWDALRAGKVQQAVESSRQLNHAHPKFAPGWHTTSHVAIRLNQPHAALAAIQKALDIEPGRPTWQLQYAMCLLKVGRVDEVVKVVDSLQGQPLRTAYENSSLAMLLTQLGRREEAVNWYEEAASLEPHESKHHYNLACLQRSLGDIEAAEQSFDAAIERNPADYEAWKVRSELRRQTADANHVAELERALESAGSQKAAVPNLCYALAKELEDLEEYDRSFDYLARGADSRRRHMQYDLQRDLDTMTMLRETFSGDVFAAPPQGHDSREPIFILGLPRTGTTLVERILSTHTDVFAAGELNNFAVEMMRLAREGLDPAPADRDELVRRSIELDPLALGRAYVSSTRPFTGHTPRFIDKMPLNYLYVGLIHRALPNARIICLRRNPLDTCYAIYKQLFIDAYPFSYDLEELGRYFAAYDRLMQHWRDVLPGVIHTVDYESLVDDLEPHARRLIEYCGLDWQPACLDFHENRSASITASTTQVRQPVYRSSVGKWRHYERQLAPLIETLRSEGVSIGD